MIFQGKVVGKDTPEDNRRRDAAALYKKAAEMGYAPAQFNYAMALNDGHGAKTNPALFEQYLTKARALSYPLAQTFSQKSYQGSRSMLEGFTGEERWAYEFIEHEVEPTATLATDSSGLIVFADSNHVVRSAEFGGTAAAGSIKTELSFYDARSGRLSAVLAVPNRVFQVGRVTGTENGVYYVGTVTAAKYRYDDHPLAITLVDLLSRTLERIPLVQEDDGLAESNSVNIVSSSKQIYVYVQPGLSSQYLRAQPMLFRFREIKLAIKETRTPEEEPCHHEINKDRHLAFVKDDPAALDYLGAAPSTSKDPAKSRGLFAVGGADAAATFPQILKSGQNGLMVLFDFGRLNSRVFDMGHKRASAAHFFDEGSFACITGDHANVISADGFLQVPLPGTHNQSAKLIAAADEYQPQVRQVNSDEVDVEADSVIREITFGSDSIGYRLGSNFFQWKLGSTSGFQKCELPAEIREKLRKNNSEHITDWDIGTQTFVLFINENENRGYQRFCSESGRLKGSSWSGGGHNAYLGVLPQTE